MEEDDTVQKQGDGGKRMKGSTSDSNCAALLKDEYNASGR
jgi:hypothetical protein